MPQKIPADIHPRLVSFGRKTVSAALVSAVLFSSANAAGLGKLTVLSSLGQPLLAEIELTSVSKEEAGSLVVKLASTEAFRQASIELNPALLALRFSIQKRGNGQFIRVTSNQPMNEPFIDMLVEVGGANNRLVREYTFLLDPADLRRTQPVQVAAPIVRTPDAAVGAGASSPAESGLSNSRAVPAAQRAEAAKPENGNKARQSAPTTRTAAQNSAGADTYEVKRGDTLAGIATQLKAEGISLDQMLVALQRANPDAFINNNINRLRAGQILSVPGAETVRGIPNGEAKGVVVAQAADFNAYRNKLAGQVAGSTPQDSAAARQSATGKITTKVEDQASAVNESRDKLRLSKSGATAGSDKTAVVAAGAEERIAREKALAEANARVRELEKNVSDLQKILEIKNKELADRQTLAEASKAGSNATVAAAAPPAPSKPIVGQVAGSITPPVVPGITPAAPAAAGNAAASIPVAVKPAPVTTSVAPPPVATPPKRTVVTPPPPLPEPSFLDEILANPLLLALLAVLVAGLGVLGIYSGRKKKQQKDFQDTNMLMNSSLKANSMFGSTGGQSVDTNNSVFNSNFTPSSSQLDTNEVDPVAEADVYIAYGRDAQAEEILKEALRTHPERQAVRLKLLEIYASRKDKRGFEVVASELYAMTKGKGEEWSQAASLGIAMDPKNPLYAGGKISDAGSANTVAASTVAAVAAVHAAEEINFDGLLNTVPGSKPMFEQSAVAEPVSSYADNKFQSTEIPVLDTESDAPAMQPLMNAPQFTSPPPAPAVPAPAADADAGMDFDFDMEGLGIKELALPPETSTSVDFSPVISTPDAPVQDLAPPSDMMDFDFLQNAPVAAEVSEKPSDTTAELPAEDLAPFDLTFPEVADEPHAITAAPNAPTPLDFDLSGISLDLNPLDSTPSIQPLNTLDATPSILPVAEEASVDSQFNLAEMATKLDLALAYQEIGDRDGARELLDEVVKGGNAEQMEKARSMLQKLS